MRNLKFTGTITEWVSVSVSAMSYPDVKYSIRMKDAEFVGEDPVLMAELTRRMPNGSVEPDLGSVLPPRVRTRLLDTAAARDALHHQLAEVDALSARYQDVNTKNLTNIERQRKREEDRRYKAYINQPNDTVVEMFALQMVEQAIYAVQYRLKEVEHYTNKYNQDIRYRIGYIFRQIEQWIYEMEVMYSYVTNEDRKNLREYNIYKNLIYYSHFVQKNFDITYTIYHLLKLHTDLVESVKTMSPTLMGNMQADPRDMDMNDPATMDLIKGMMEDHDYDLDG